MDAPPKESAQPVSEPLPARQATPLTAANLTKHDKEAVEEKPVEPTRPAAKSKVVEDSAGNKKPKWAMTEKQADEVKEQEVDDLVDFAYQLDYEKYIEDFEVRQAINVLKERVQELKKDGKWKENFAEKWNAPAKPDTEENKKADVAPKPAEDDKLEIQSVRSACKSVKSERTLGKVMFIGSAKSKTKSVISAKSIAESVRAASEAGKSEWNSSVKAEPHLATVEDKIAAQIAEQVLESAPVFSIPELVLAT